MITLSFNALRGGAVIDIVDVAGRVVGTTEVSDVSRRTIEFDSSKLTDGLYFVSVQQSGKRFTDRIVVAH